MKNSVLSLQEDAVSNVEATKATMHTQTGKWCSK